VGPDAGRGGPRALPGRRVLLVSLLGTFAGLLALADRHDEAREKLDTAAGYAAELRMRGAEVGLAYMRGTVESIAGAHEAAADSFGTARNLLLGVGQVEGAALLEAYLARELMVLDRPVPDRFALCTEEQAVAIADPRRRALTLVISAYCAVLDGDPPRAGSAADLAMSAVAPLEDPFFQGIVHEDCAALLRRAGLAEQSAEAARRAGSYYRAKGIVTRM